ncbi:MAG TPA: carbohydrate kinase [Trichocoleus sp.]
MGAKVICLGECLMDRLFGQPDQVDNALVNWQDYPGGAPANVAVALSKLGTPASFVGCLGMDDPGEVLFNQLEQAGVRCEAIQRHLTAPTRVVLVMRDAAGDRQFVGFHLPDPTGFADAHLAVARLDEAMFAEAAFLVMGTLGLAYADTGQSMEQALTWARQQGVITVVDLNWRPAFWPDIAIAPQRIRPFIAQVDLLKLSEDEALWLFQTGDPQVILKNLPQAQAVVITAGAEGCRYATRQVHGSLPAFQVDSEDTTGAGDAFLAGLIHQLAKQGMASLEESATVEPILRYASAVGALTTMRAGAMAAQPQAREVEAFLYLNS